MVTLWLYQPLAFGAVVAAALVKVGKRALKTKRALWIAITAFLALVLGAPFPLVIVVAALIGAIQTLSFAERAAAQRWVRVSGARLGPGFLVREMSGAKGSIFSV